MYEVIVTAVKSDGAGEPMVFTSKITFEYWDDYLDWISTSRGTFETLEAK